MRMFTALTMVVITTLGAPDATGRWTGTLKVATAPDTQSGKLILVLKQAGVTLTGTVARRGKTPAVLLVSLKRAAP